MLEFQQQAVAVGAALLGTAVVDDLDGVAALLLALLEDGGVVGAAAEELPEAATHGGRFVLVEIFERCVPWDFDYERMERC